MDPEQAVERLGRIDVLTEASPSQLSKLAECVAWRRVAQGEEVISHLSLDKRVFFISEGVLRVRLEPLPGRGVQIRLLREGRHFGELAVLADSPRSVTVSAETHGLLAECPSDVFLALMRENGAIAVAVARSLARMTVSLTDRLFETAALEVRFRVQSELLRLAKYGELTPEGIIIRQAPTHAMIAKSVGTHREAVTKEFRQLTAEGLLRQERRDFVIPDVGLLRNLVQKHAGLTASLIVDW